MSAKKSAKQKEKEKKQIGIGLIAAGIIYFAYTKGVFGKGTGTTSAGFGAGTTTTTTDAPQMLTPKQKWDYDIANQYYGNVLQDYDDNYASDQNKQSTYPTFKAFTDWVWNQRNFAGPRVYNSRGQWLSTDIVNYGSEFQ